MSGVGEALKRKLGPLPVWAWAIIAGIAIYWYRNKYGSSATVSGTGTGSVGPAPTTPQPQQVLQPGESVYDPNTGTLSTAPGGGAASGDPSASIDALTSAIDSALTQLADMQPTNTGASTTDTPSAPATPPAAQATTGPAPGSSAGPHGAIYARSGATKPPPKKGYRTVGIGNGRWIYIPTGTRKSAKPKPATAGRPKTTSRTGKVGKTLRSTASVRNVLGGRGSKRTKRSPSSVTMRNAPTRTGSRARQRPTHNVVSEQRTTQRPAATHPAPPTRRVLASPPRPSAPPPRHTRTPARKHR